MLYRNDDLVTEFTMAAILSIVQDINGASNTVQNNQPNRAGIKPAHGC